MDHLSQVADPLRWRIEVPYIVQQEDEYDNLGLHRRVEREFSKRERTRDETLSFLQSWCFFGLVTEVLRVPGVRVNAHDFITTGKNGQRYLTTRRLLSCLQLWVAIEIGLSKEVMDYHRQEIQSLLNTVSSFLLLLFNDLKMKWPKGYMEKSGSDDCTPYTHCGVLLSIVILGESLSQCFETVYVRYNCMGVYWPNCWFLEDLLLRAGWCRYEIKLLRNRYLVGNTGLYYMSFIDRRLIGKDHNNCSEEVCGVDNIKEATYQTKHVVDSCHCRDAIEDSDIHQMTQIVLKGRVPLYSVTEDERGNCVVSIRAFETGYPGGEKAPYVALSHVWADGLGNPSRNSLPKCQMLQLQKLCDALYKSESELKYRPIPFWIDTLCVPKEEGLKREAIAMLALTFKEADKVLTLDKSLLQTSVQVEMREALMKILCSSWARRLWTFQEGAFSKSLHFQFQDGSIHEGDIRNRRAIEVRKLIIEDFESNIELRRRGIFLPPLTNDLVSADENLLRLMLGLDYVFATAWKWFELLVGEQITKGTVSNGKKLAYLMQIFGWRSATKPKDEAVCLATLLGQNAKEIMALEEQEDRMEKVFLNAQDIPADIIFCYGPRLTKDNCGWIPKTWLHQAPIACTPRQIARPSPSGLMVEYAGLRLDFADTVFRDSGDSVICVGTRPGTIWHVSFSDRYLWEMHIDGGTTLDQGTMIPDQGAVTPKWTSFVSPQMAIILPVQQGVPGGFSALVTIKEERDGVLFTTFERIVVVVEISPETGADEGGRDLPTVRVTTLPQSQKWCVG